ncbi:uncharacterized protein BJ171DRAFT_528948 [Polychytrium aggregatum]|uniref:uncharacterized protein n=1 Tax=Polychytrium aggregatum TaxID=110093 RepID=UPI0022FDDEF8|nr:uncharacterized protein BJ171DRAFT_528948 [Polychytrium aggregatum]KAI9193349.1 hypothetical protein BJ171DRAFT_528948 [Polychytrium aggregatum]
MSFVVPDLAQTASPAIVRRKGTWALCLPGDFFDPSLIESVVPPAAIENRIRRDGSSEHHITLIDPSEPEPAETLLLQSAHVAPGELIDLGIGKVVRGASTTWFKIICWPQGQLIRSQLGYTQWKHFHATLGFLSSDVHDGPAKDSTALARTSIRDADAYAKAAVHAVQMSWKALSKVGSVRASLVDFSLGVLESAYEIGLAEETSYDVLACRAFIHTQSSNLSHAISDALWLVETCPAKALGWIRAGDCFFKQKLPQIANRFFWKAALLSSKDSAHHEHAVTRLKDCALRGWISLAIVDPQAIPYLGHTRLSQMTSAEQNSYAALLPAIVLDLQGQEFDLDAQASRERTLVDLAGSREPYHLPRFFSWIVPQFLAGMSTPKSRDDIVALEAIGIRYIITLTEETPLPVSWFEGTAVVNYFWPTTNYHPPHLAQAEEFIHTVITHIHGPHRGGVLVHCGGGKGRAGSLLALYLARYGTQLPPSPCSLCSASGAVVCEDPACCYGSAPIMSAEMAIARLRYLRPGSIETDRQESFVHEYVSQLWKHVGRGLRIERRGLSDADLTVQIQVHGSSAIPELVVLVGLPGCGKSWFAKKLLESSPHWHHISQDESGSRSACEREVSNHAKRLGAQCRLIIDRCNSTPEDRRAWLDLTFNPRRSAVVYFDVSSAVCIDRIHHRWNHATVKPHQAQTVVGHFQSTLVAPSLSEGFSTMAVVKSFADVEDLVQRWSQSASLPGSAGLAGQDSTEDTNTPVSSINGSHRLENFVKFPRTEHLVNLGAGSVACDDIVMDPRSMAQFLTLSHSEVLTIEEKVDGANLGFRISPTTGEIECQNRSHYVNSKSHPQFKELRNWMFQHEHSLRKILSSANLILFGEWMYAKHSIHYLNLPDYFIAFDIYDVDAGTFYSRDMFHRALSNTTLQTAPVLDSFSHSTLSPQELSRDLLTYLNRQSGFALNTRIEGIVVRIDCGDWLVKRAKIVRPDFICGNAHWSSRQIQKNELGPSN